MSKKQDALNEKGQKRALAILRELHRAASEFAWLQRQTRFHAELVEFFTEFRLGVYDPEAPDE